MTDRVEVKTLTSIKRRNNTPSTGCPSFVLGFDDGTEARTEANVSDNYAICDYFLGKTFTVTFTKKGEIAYIAPLAD